MLFLMNLQIKTCSVTIIIMDRNEYAICDTCKRPFYEEIKFRIMRKDETLAFCTDCCRGTISKSVGYNL